MPSRTHISPPTQLSGGTCTRAGGNASEPLSHTHCTPCSISHMSAAWGALYTCTRYPGLTARMVVGSRRAMDALPHSDLAATTPIE